MSATKKRKLWPKILLGVLAVLVLACGLYLSDYYAPEEAALETFGCNDSPLRQELADGAIAYVPEAPEAGFLFYPGGKVDHRAYEPLMLACAEKNILCVVVEMPFRLAVLDVNAADGIREQFPQVDRWYIGGHSLGGSMAASYLESNPEGFDGLILLAAYATGDLSGLDIEVLSLLASQDQVLNREKYSQYRPNLPEDTLEFTIDGGCHAYFGAYGPQEGDGTPTIDNQQQLQITAEQIAALIAE